MKKIVLIYLTALNLVAYSQTTTIVNQKSFGGNLDENFNDMVQLQNNNYLILSSSQSGQTGNKTTINYGGLDYWLINLNTDFTINWQKGFGGSGDDFTNKLIEVSDGGFICVGSSNSPISGNKTAPNIGGNDYWVIKLNNLGIVEWQKTYGGTGDDNAKTITELPNGDFLIGGFSNSPISGDKTSASYGGNDYWLLKIDNLGNVIWDKTIGGSLNEELSDLFVDSNNSIYLTGSSQSNISGDKTENNYGQTDAWLLKLDNSANIIWDKTLGGSNAEFYPKTVLINNYLYVNSGSFSPVSGNKTAIPIGGGDFWLVKLDTNSNIIWDKSYGTNRYFAQGDIIKLNDSKMVIYGSENNGGTTPASCLTLFLDTNGTQLYQKIIKGQNNDILTNTVYLSNNHFVLLGSSTSGVGDDKTTPNIGGADIWLVEVTTNLGVNKNILTNNYNLYPNPNQGEFSISGLIKNSKVEIYTINGAFISSFTVGNNTELTINTVLPKGMYFVKIKRDGVFEYIKFIVN